MKRRLFFAAMMAWCGVGCAPASHAPADSGPLRGAGVAVEPDGRYTVTFVKPAWRFGGTLGAAAKSVTVVAGSDADGAFHETRFDWNDGASRSGVIRAYDAAPVVIFTATLHEAAPNRGGFPRFDRSPDLPHHVSYQSILFAPPSSSTLAPDSPWIFFDDAANTFVLSAASHFTNAATARAGDGSITSGIDPSIATLPAGFQHSVALVAAPGINRTLDLWGAALLRRTGKTRPASDATVDLERLGYWTDNGASYYYKFDAQKGYAGTLTAVRDAFAQAGLPLGYLQLDSWWYPKGASDTWNGQGGIDEYVADPTLFPSGLPAFQSSLALPLITHARWIDPGSPYRGKYAMSRNTITDAAYWNGVADYLQSAGVITYEQDWLDQMALPATDNLDDQDAFLDNMAAAMTSRGLSLQYCMPLPRHFLQSTKYPNLRTIRVTIDRFGPARWHDFVYVSRLASAVGAWPWVDVFMSGEHDNLLLATLSAGMVGVGDALGSIDAEALRQVARADGVIVKPDAPLVPLDQSWLDEAQGNGAPMVASTYSDFGGLRASYVFAFGAASAASFTPARLGYDRDVVVREQGSGAASRLSPSQTFSGRLSNGSGYFVVAPLARSGVALLGDAGKLVPLGKKRVARLADDVDALRADLVFAAGDGPVSLRIWSPRPPRVTAAVGAVGAVRRDPADAQLFVVDVTPAGGVASIAIAAE